MILDWDVHHGNGTNDLFYDDDSVLMIDMHEDGVWPGSGQLEETGTGRGQGYTINIPMPSMLCHVLCHVLAIINVVYHAANVVLPSILISPSVFSINTAALQVCIGCNQETFLHSTL